MPDVDVTITIIKISDDKLTAEGPIQKLTAEGVPRIKLVQHQTVEFVSEIGEVTVNFPGPLGSPFGGPNEVKGKQPQGKPPLKVAVEKGVFPFQCGVKTPNDDIIGWPKDKQSVGAECEVSRR